jgi:AhpD family alkylhydroperoxidase
MARLSYPERDALEQEAAQALAGMKPMNVFRMLARADALAPPIFDTATQLFTKGRTELSPRLRQIAILRVAGATGCDYLIAHHEPISRRCRLSDDEIEACKSGRTQALAGHEQAVASYATESTLQIDVADATFDAMRSGLTDRQVVELTVVIGFYNFLARFLKALKVEVEVAPAGQ